MSLLRVRFTVRSMMVGVAIGGLLLGLGTWLWHRSVQFRGVAEYHNRLALESLGRGYEVDPSGGTVHVSVRTPRSDYHDRRMRKYRQAAARPWLPVESDPPEPD